MSFDPVDLVPPAKMFVPRLTDMLNRGNVMPRYVPGPLAEGMVRLVLSSAGADGEPPDFEPYETYWTTPGPRRVFDIPVEKYEQWEAIKAAFTAMGEQIEELLYPTPTKTEDSAH